MTLKRLLKQAVKGVVPDSVLTRSKRGFGTPMGWWLRKNLQPMVQEILEDSEFRREGLYNPVMVRDMLAVHQRGYGDFTEAIFALLTFELWRRRYRVTVP